LTSIEIDLANSGIHRLPDGTAFGHKLEHDLSEGCVDGRSLYLQCNNCGRYHEVKIGCGKRFDYFCKNCAKKWRKKVFARYWRGICAMKHPRFLTLTLLKKKGGMEARLRSLWPLKKDLFRILREGRGSLKGRTFAIGSWCGIIEPPNHVHIVLDCEKYIPQNDISDVWKTLTGDSYIVDIRELYGDRRQMAAYITKYLTKASAWTGINLDLLKGFHLIASYDLPQRPPPKAICPCGIKALHPIDLEQFSSDLYYYENNCPLKEYVDRFALSKGENFIVE